jgi:hypothetical protein
MYSRLQLLFKIDQLFRDQLTAAYPLLHSEHLASERP